MKALELLSRLLVRLRYPVSLPEDVAEALGIHLSNSIPFSEFINKLTCPQCKPTRLTKFMPRATAEEAFTTAHCKERFQNNTLFSYYFNEGWLEFILQFDDHSRLRRIYVQHKGIQHDQGVELSLERCSQYCHSRQSLSNLTPVREYT